MEQSKLKISIKDWFFIILIGALFGFFISLFFYFLNNDLKEASTVIFSTISAVLVSLFAFIFITLSNDYILPKVNEKFWYLISFFFSFASGFFGFATSFYIFSFTDFRILDFIEPFWFYISCTIGFLTFLIGLILHQFISMKYKNEIITSDVLETKIKALEGELNPHFLFNALNSISELIYIDQGKAEKATLDLSQFLRNAITRDSLVFLEAELSMVKTYLEIENIRFNGKISLDINLSEDSSFVRVPKFSIQLLVENAIKHGFKGEPLHIEIIANKDEIVVSNNGTVPEEVKYGTGLSNLKKRLELLKIGRLKFEPRKDRVIFIIELDV